MIIRDSKGFMSNKLVHVYNEAMCISHKRTSKMKIQIDREIERENFIFDQEIVEQVNCLRYLDVL